MISKHWIVAEYFDTILAFLCLPISLYFGAVCAYVFLFGRFQVGELFKKIFPNKWLLINSQKASDYRSVIILIVVIFLFQLLFLLLGLPFSTHDFLRWTNIPSSLRWSMILLNSTDKLLFVLLHLIASHLILSYTIQSASPNSSSFCFNPLLSYRN